MGTMNESHEAVSEVPVMKSTKHLNETIFVMFINNS